MPLGFNFGADGGASTSSRSGAARQAAAWQNRSEDRIAVVHTRAMRDVTDKYEGELRADVRAGGFQNGARLAKVWRSEVYPRGRNSMEPAGFIWTKAAILIDAFTLGVTIQAASGHYLAIPQGPAKAIVRRLNAAASKGTGGFGRNADGQFADLGSYVNRVAAALGIRKLDFRLDPHTGRGVIVAVGRTLTKRGFASGRAGADTVLFVLVRSAKLKKRLRGRELLADFTRRFPSEFAAAVEHHAGEVE